MNFKNVNQYSDSVLKKKYVFATAVTLSFKQVEHPEENNRPKIRKKLLGPMTKIGKMNKRPFWQNMRNKLNKNSEIKTINHSAIMKRY